MVKSVKVILIINGIFNFIGAAVLFLGTTILNHVTGFTGDTNLLWYLLGVCSLSLAILAIGAAARIRERTAIITVLLTLLVFNFLSGVVSLIGLFNGMSIKILGNTGMHLVLVFLLIVFGLKRLKEKE